MIYLDSNVFIYATTNNDEIGRKCRKILTDVAENNIEASTSVLTWDEVTFVIRKLRGNEIAKIKGKNLLNFPNLRWLKADKKILDLSQNIVEKYHLKPRDSIHLATAIENKASKLVSDDSDFEKIKEIKIIKPSPGETPCQE